MTETQLYNAAISGAEMPEGLGQAEQLFFTSIRNIYAAMTEGRIDYEQAKRERGELVRAFRKYHGREETALDLTRRFAARIFDTEQDRNAFQQAKIAGADDRTMLQLACKIARVATGDATITIGE